MRIVFAGSPEAAIASLQALVAAPHEIVGVISQPDRPVGRARTVMPTPVASFARAHGLRVFTPHPRENLAAIVEDLHPDLAIAVAYGRKIDLTSLSIPRHGWWNLHFSLLPAWRGAAPVQHALLNGQAATGITVFQMDQGLDTGPILHSAEYAIAPGITAGELLMELSEFGAGALVEAIDLLQAGALAPRRQEGAVSFAPKLPREVGWLRCGEPTPEVFARYQACTPEPGAYLRVRGSEGTLLVRRARLAEGGTLPLPGHTSVVDGDVAVGCRGGAILVERVVVPGSREMSGADWSRGAGRGVTFEL